MKLIAFFTVVSAAPQPEKRTRREVPADWEPDCPNQNSINWVPGDCTKFYLCDRGIPNVIQTCGPGTAYSTTLKVCVFPFQANCDAPFRQPAPTTTTTTTTTQTTISTSTTTQAQTEAQTTTAMQSSNTNTPNTTTTTLTETTQASIETSTEELTETSTTAITLATNTSMKPVVITTTTPTTATSRSTTEALFTTTDQTSTALNTTTKTTSMTETTQILIETTTESPNETTSSVFNTQQVSTPTPTTTQSLTEPLTEVSTQENTTGGTSTQASVITNVHEMGDAVLDGKGPYGFSVSDVVNYGCAGRGIFDPFSKTLGRQIDEVDKSFYIWKTCIQCATDGDQEILPLYEYNHITDSCGKLSNLKLT